MAAEGPSVRGKMPVYSMSLAMPIGKPSRSHEGSTLASGSLALSSNASNKPTWYPSSRISALKAVAKDLRAAQISSSENGEASCTFPNSVRTSSLRSSSKHARMVSPVVLRFAFLATALRGSLRPPTDSAFSLSHRPPLSACAHAGPTPG